AGWAGGCCPGATGAGAADFGAGFENCSRMERPAPPLVVRTCTAKAMEVNMNITAHHVVALDRNVAAPRGPNAVWLPEPPNAPARSAAEPLCSMMTMISTKQTNTCSVTR